MFRSVCLHCQCIWWAHDYTHCCRHVVQHVDMFYQKFLRRPFSVRTYFTTEQQVVGHWYFIRIAVSQISPGVIGEMLGKQTYHGVYLERWRSTSKNSLPCACYLRLQLAWPIHWFLHTTVKHVRHSHNMQTLACGCSDGAFQVPGQIFICGIVCSRRRLLLGFFPRTLGRRR